MDMLNITKFNWLKTLSPVAIAASVFLAGELPANAVPHISAPSSNRYSVYSSRPRKISSSQSLTITPPPGRHISLPRLSSRYRYYPSHGRYHRYDRHHRRRVLRRRRRVLRRRRRVLRNRRGHKRIIIINPVLRY